MISCRKKDEYGIGPWDILCRDSRDTRRRGKRKREKGRMARDKKRQKRQGDKREKRQSRRETKVAEDKKEKKTRQTEYKRAECGALCPGGKREIILEVTGTQIWKRKKDLSQAFFRNNRAR